jgi:hypothetical protein
MRMPRNLNVPNGVSKESVKVTFSELGVSGLERYSGIIGEEWLNELSDLYRANKVYKEMRDNEPLIGAILLATDMIIRKVRWYVKEGGSSDKALKKAEFLESCINDFSDQNWNDIISEILSMLVFGWSTAEKVYKLRKEGQSKFPDGKVGWARWGFRAQETLFEWNYNNEGKLIGFTQCDPVNMNYIFIPIEKILLFRTKIYKDNPQGRSWFRTAFKPWWFKKHLEEFEAIGLEHTAVGVVVGWVPKAVLTDSTQAALKTNFGNAITKIQTGKGAAILLPLEYDANGNKKYDLTLLSGNSKTSEIAQIGSVIERYEMRIVQSCLYEISMIGTKGGGSYALAENKSNSFTMALGTILEIVKSIINDNAVNELFKLNGDDMQELPTIEFMPIVKADLKEVGEYLKNLAASGAVIWPNRALSKFIMEIANMPVQTDDEIEESLNVKEEDQKLTEEDNQVDETDEVDEEPLVDETDTKEPEDVVDNEGSN